MRSIPLKWMLERNRIWTVGILGGVPPKRPRLSGAPMPRRIGGPKAVTAQHQQPQKGTRTKGRHWNRAPPSTTLRGPQQHKTQQTGCVKTRNHPRRTQQPYRPRMKSIITSERQSRLPCRSPTRNSRLDRLNTWTGYRPPPTNLTGWPKRRQHR